MANIPNYFPGQDARLYGDELNQSLQDSISDNGFAVPNQPTSTIVNLAAEMPKGTLWYDSDTNQLKAQIDGVIRIIQLV